MRKLFFAVSRVNLESTVEIGPGLSLLPTYAHVFAHPMLAVKPPAEAGKHHPAPWTIVNSSGHVETAAAQLVVEMDAKTDGELIFKARNVLGMLRLLSGTPIRAPIFSKVSFEAIAAGEKCEIVWEFEPPLRWDVPNFALADIEKDLPDILPRLEAARFKDSFSKAFGLLDSIWWIPSLSAQMIAIWSSAETLMQPGRSSMTKELAKLVRAALGNDRSEGDRYYNEVIRLCSARGSAAHAAREPDPLDVQDSYGIVRRLMIHSLLSEVEIQPMIVP